MDVLKEKLLVRIIVYAKELAIVQSLFLPLSPLRVEEKYLEHILLFMREATPAKYQQLQLLLLFQNKTLHSLLQSFPLCLIHQQL